MSKFEVRPASAEDYWRGHPLREFHVQHMGLSLDVITAFQECVNDAADEKAVQAFLETHPGLLVHTITLSKPHGRA